MKGGRQKEGYGCHRPKARKNPHQRSDQNSYETEKKISRLKRNLEAQQDILEKIHPFSPLKTQWARGKLGLQPKLKNPVGSQSG